MMLQSSSLASTLSLIPQRYLAYFGLQEFQDPEYNPRENAPKDLYTKGRRLTEEGLKHTITLINWLGYQLTDFRDNLLKGDNRSLYFTRKAQEVHQIIEDVESLEERLKRENIPIIREVLNSDLGHKVVESLFSKGHNLTDLAEKCALDVLEAVRKMDVRKIVSDYFEFVRKTVDSTLGKTGATQEISWREFKERCLDKPNYEARQKYLMPFLQDMSLEQLEILTRRYGLDGAEPESIIQIARRLSKQHSEVTMELKIAFERLQENLVTSKILLVRRKIAGTRRDYKGNPYGIYKKENNGISRGSLARIANKTYQSLLCHGQLSLVPRKNREYNGNPHAMYLEKYNGVARGELSVIDPPLYKALRLARQLFKVPSKRRDFNRDPYGYYLTNLSDKSLSWLIKNDEPLYRAIRRQGKLSLIPRDI